MGNVLLALAALLLLAAALAPRWRARLFEQRVEAVAAAVDALRSDAEAALASTGSWPPAAEIPSPVPDLPSESPPVTVAWNRLASAVVPPPPTGTDAALPEADEGFAPAPPLPAPEYFERGAVSVHAADDALLASLLERYPGSFVHDTVWTLLLPRVSAPPD